MASPNTGCPGLDLRWLKIEQIACPACGYDVEFFSDERARKCPRCGLKVDRLRETNCAEWCAAAESCALLRGLDADELGSGLDESDAGSGVRDTGDGPTGMPESDEEA